MCYLHWWWTIAVINSRSIPPPWVKLDYTGSICMCLHTHTHVWEREEKTGEKKSLPQPLDMCGKFEDTHILLNFMLGPCVPRQRKGTGVLWAQEFTCLSCSTQEEREMIHGIYVSVCSPSADNSSTSVNRLRFLQDPLIIKANLLFIYIHKNTNIYI